MSALYIEVYVNVQAIEQAGVYTYVKRAYGLP